MTCTPPSRNTLTSACHGVCGSPPLCVVYAAAPAAESRIGDGTYYYQGCAFAGMPSCRATGACDVQCLQTANARQESWTLDVAQPQMDKPETALFLHVEGVALPPTLANLSIVGTTELTRKVPISFATGVFQDSTALERVNILDVAIENITSNIFPPSLKSLTIQRAKLQQFAPRGNQPFPALRVLDLSENALTEIPSVVYEMRNLTELYLQGNAITDAHITPPQLAYLKALTTFRGSFRLSSNTACQDGYQKLAWSADRTICYGGDDLIGADVESGDIHSGITGETSTNNSSSTASSTSSIGSVIVLVAVAVFVVLAVLAGVFLLKRAKRKATQPPAKESKQKLSALAIRAKFSSSKSKSLLDEFSDPLQGSFRKNAFQEIPATHVHVSKRVAMNGAVYVSTAEYNSRSVFVLELRLPDDEVMHNCELALDIVPALSQLRHPQLLSVVGLLDHDDSHFFSPVTVVCEHMALGTLESYLLRCGKELTWKGFKQRAALEVAGCLMYLHTKHKVAYGALNGKSVFVDGDKGCKLNTLLASMPEEAALTACDGADDEEDYSSHRGFLAPELLLDSRSTAPARSSADMFAFGVLLVQLDLCLPAHELVLHPEPILSLEESGDSSSICLTATSSSSAGNLNSDSGTNLISFTNECPSVVKELARACLQYDASLRPSASYVVAMLQQQPC